MIDCVIDIKDERREKVIDRNESDENEAFFISSMIDCIIDVEDKSESQKTWKSEENKNKNNITEKLLIITKTFWPSCIARRIRAFWV